MWSLSFSFSAAARNARCFENEKEKENEETTGDAGRSPAEPHGPKATCLLIVDMLFWAGGETDGGRGAAWGGGVRIRVRQGTGLVATWVGLCCDPVRTWARIGADFGSTRDEVGRECDQPGGQVIWRFASRCTWRCGTDSHACGPLLITRRKPSARLSFFATTPATTSR